MSEETPQLETSAFKYPKPFWPESASVSKDGVYQPVDTINITARSFIGSALFLGGTQFRRLLQFRRGSARPGLAKYLNMFQLTKPQLLGLPVGIGAYAFLSSSIQNIQETDKSFTGEFAAASLATLITSSIANASKGVARNLQLSVGVGSFFALLAWGKGLGGLAENSYNQTKLDGRLNNQEDAQVPLEKPQGFWDVVYRRPLSVTVEELGEGRGILKP
ncbi:unnamed protein product [Kuraishia capsulata CBS 1993]|uniref:Uncharacterized protein n=1 Tax=Kuraishia capsulata CBS 1993 TaxID=1382522 RepID=W6MT48_9ASCO|nr:uncharacterized protein KUCA_T00005913001 [Kuraishia capsulata CBS 1993]CDK29919.1 unnamed protein product [Kuraishia capsulata CBS 1993]